MKSEVYKRKVDIQDELLARILDAAVRVEKRDDNWDEQHAVLTQELQSELRLRWDIRTFTVNCNEFVVSV
jgi:hypothetical protein